MSNIPGAFARREKCPCCNNPWNQEDGGNLVSASIACKPCLTDSKGYKGLDPSNFDNSVAPGENFYLWSNGGWKTKNPIPAEYSSWNTFIVLRDLNIERLKTLLDDLATSNDTTSPNAEEHQKLKEFYSAFMDETKIDSQGIEPIRPILELCDNLQNSPTETIARLHSQYGINIFFGIYAAPDKQNSNHTIASLFQTGLGLPDRDYYFDVDKEEKRTQYLVYIRELFQLLGQMKGYEQYASLEYCDIIAQDILSLETTLATWHLTRTMSRDPRITYNKMKVKELQALMQQNYSAVTSYGQYLTSGIVPCNEWFNWEEYFSLIGKSCDILGEINVSSKELLSKFFNVLLLQKNSDSNSSNSNRRNAVVHYAMFHVLNNIAPHLSSSFVQIHFNFHETILKGTSMILPRWKRGLQTLETALGEALGKLYAAQYFTANMKDQALQIVQEVKQALRERIEEVTWMSTATKQAAFRKMEQFAVKIGYPDHWKDYSTLLPQISSENHVQNILASRAFDFALEITRMNAPTDKTRWFMTPQTVNAYYHPSLNEIVFPAAILQPPFFDPEADLAVQFGSLGAVVGHEMTHGFDDQGRKYDFEGNLNDWWAPEDGKEYEKRVQVMISQAEQFTVYGNKLNGKLTCGENIADLGGVKLALRALQKHLSSSPSSFPMINGLTPLQRFFLAWSQSWRENAKQERAIQLVTIDPHGPNELRCNGTVRNISEFYEAFGITTEDKIYLSPKERVDVW